MGVFSTDVKKVVLKGFNIRYRWYGFGCSVRNVVGHDMWHRSQWYSLQVLRTVVILVASTGGKATIFATFRFPNMIIQAARKNEKIHVRILMVVIQYSEIKTKGIRKIRD